MATREPVLPPVGYEYWSSHRSLRTLAERLAQNGCLALRFDFDGTGDSFSAQALAAGTPTPLTAGGQATFGGTTFTWPSAVGAPDNVIADGQIIDLSGSGTDLDDLRAEVNISKHVGKDHRFAGADGVALRLCLKRLATDNAGSLHHVRERHAGLDSD